MCGNYIREMKEKQDLRGLCKALNLNIEPDIRAQAARAIGEMLTEKTLEIETILGGKLTKDNFVELLSELCGNIGMRADYLRKKLLDELITEKGLDMQPLIFLTLLYHTIFDEAESVRYESAKTLIDLEGDTAINVLATIAAKGNIGMKELELPWGGSEAVLYYSKKKIGLITESEVRCNAIEVLGKLAAKIPDIRNVLTTLAMKDDDSFVRRKAKEVLKEIEAKKSQK